MENKRKKREQLLNLKNDLCSQAFDEDEKFVSTNLSIQLNSSMQSIGCGGEKVTGLGTQSSVKDKEGPYQEVQINESFNPLQSFEKTEKTSPQNEKINMKSQLIKDNFGG